MNYAKDLHRQGRLREISLMVKKARARCKGTNDGLTPVFITQGYEGYDCYAIVANNKAYEAKQGFILWDETLNRAVYLPEQE